MPTDCPTEETIVRFAERSLQNDERSAIVSHLADCSSCRRLVAELAGASDPRPERPTVDDLATTRAEPSTEPADALPPLSILPGATIDRYRVLSIVGSGAMGVVLAAYDPKLDRKVALKLLRGLDPDPDDAQRARERLEREARAMARVGHANVVAVYDVGVHDDQVFVAMEFVEGRTLGVWLAERSRGWEEILGAFLEAGRGLAAAHAAGLVHRDFKPDNVLVGWDGRTRVTDFGLARQAQNTPSTAARHDAPNAILSTALPTLTRAGAVAGTPRYMAPEQIDGEPPSARADLFSFCVALHEALFGALPFRGDSLVALRESMREGRLRDPTHGSDVPARVRASLALGLRANPVERPASMHALLARLAGDPSRRWRRWVALAAAVAACATAVSAFATWRATRSRCEFASPLAAGAWDDGRRAEVTRAFAALPLGAPMVPAVAAVLDAYAAGLERMRVEACEAATVRGEQSTALLDRRMACLDKRRHAMTALVDRLRSADAEVARNAAQAASRLPPIDDCADADTLLAEVPPPLDIETRTRAVAAMKQVAAAAAHFNTGDYKAGARIALRALGAARQVDYPPLRAEALYTHGLFLARDGARDQAKAAFKEAVWAAIVGRDDRLVARTAAQLTYVVGGRQDQDDRSQDWYDVGAAIAARLGGNALLEGRLAERRARVLLDLGRLDDAIALFERAERRFAKALGESHPEVALALGGRAVALNDRGRGQDAWALHVRARQILESKLGPSHPDVLEAIAEAAVCAPVEHIDKTVRDLARAERLLTAQLGAEHRSLVLVHHASCDALEIADRLVEAQAQCRRALAVAEKCLGRGQRRTEHARANLGAILSTVRSPEAIEHLTQALRFYEKDLGSSSTEQLSTHLENLAFAHLRLRQPERALAVLERTLAMLRAQYGPADVTAAAVHSYFGDAYRMLHRFGEAEASYARAVQLLEHHKGASVGNLGETLTGLAQLNVARSHGARAREQLERAVSLLTPMRKGESLAAARFELAKVLGATADERKRAHTLAMQARDAFAARPHAARELAEVDAWLAARR